jgi:FKBP-type peptidyl-prolyl cis-trans isomerase
MRFGSCLLLLCLLSTTVYGKKQPAKQSAPQVVLQTQLDSVSYAMGIFMGSQVAKHVEQQGWDKEVFAKAYHAALFENETLMTPDFAQFYLNEYEKTLVEQENNKRKEQQKAFFEANKKRATVVETASGLQYEVVKAGEGPFPALTDKVKVHYEGFLLDGTKFDSSIDRGKPIEFALNRVIKGWAEGVALMQPGAKYTLYIPYELGYGAQGAGNVVKPYSALIFEVELIEIVK